MPSGTQPSGPHTTDLDHARGLRARDCARAAFAWHPWAHTWQIDGGRLTVIVETWQAARDMPPAVGGVGVDVVYGGHRLSRACLDGEGEE